MNNIMVMDICAMVNTSDDSFSNMNSYIFNTSYDNICNQGI